MTQPNMPQKSQTELSGILTSNLALRIYSNPEKILDV